RLDFADFKDPAKVEKFISRFSALYDIKNPQQAPSIPSLLLGDTGIVGFGQDLLTSIQAIRR
ncbi:MAG TPA: flagellar biosynthesis protein FlgF, partial [Hyphomicrobium sp.]|nr:flagellar biosynthesis protein FlgF [Hyphomicrobium sp.]